MANEKPQNFQNHTKLVPPFHMFVLPVLMLNAGWTIYHLIKTGVSFESVLLVLMAFALLTFALFARQLSARLSESAVLVCVATALALTTPHLLARPHVLAMPVMVLWIGGLIDAADASVTHVHRQNRAANQLASFIAAGAPR